MIEVYGNLWDPEIPCEARCVTTNGVVKGNGQAVMGGGCAKEARLLFPSIPTILGGLLRNGGNHVYQLVETEEYGTIVSFPTKHHWKDPSDLDLIVQSAHELMSLADHIGTWSVVLLPRPGVGLGGLSWTHNVRPALIDILDDRFRVITFKKDS